MRDAALDGGSRRLSQTPRAGFLLTLAVAAGAVSAACGVPSRPNIVFILADDLGYGDLSSYGATAIRTPNIDRLGEEGVLFTDAHSPSSVCTPTRYSFLTGRYCWRTWLTRSALSSDGPLLIEEGRPTVASLLQSAGYFTAHIGKWHLGFGREEGYHKNREGQGTPNAWRSRTGGPDWNGELRPGPLEVGFDYFYGLPIVNSYPPYVFVENHRVVGLDPADPIVKMESRYLGIMEGGTAARWNDHSLAVDLTAKIVSQLEILAKRRQPFFLYYAPHQPHRPFTPNARFRGASEFGTYGDFIAELDWSVGEILDALDRLGLAASTLVIFSSDNGGLTAPESSRAQLGAGYGDGETAYAVPAVDHRANGPVLRGGKGDIWEGGHRVPFLARWPGKIKAGTRSAETVTLADMMATFAAVAGVEVPQGAGPDSFNVLPALVGGTLDKSAGRPRVMHSGGNGMLAIRKGPWKLIDGQGGGGYQDGEAEVGAPPQLYNLDEDLGETRDLYAQERETALRLQEALRRIRTEGRSR
ncbi:MAG: arylsulfatase [Bryobacterales bacterium]|nr:arylsulfatase [Bryobacterales bacterium]